MTAVSKEPPKVPDDVAFFVIEKKKKKQVYLQPTLSAIDFGFPGMCIKQQQFAGIRYLKHSAPLSPYHVWELLWKDEAEEERGRSSRKSRDSVHSLQVETTNEGYHQILDRIDLWSVKSSEKEKANKSCEPSPSPRSPLHPSAKTPPEATTPTEEKKKPSAMSSLFHAITSRSKSPISRKAGSPLGSPLREFGTSAPPLSAVESLPVRSQSDISGRRTMDAISRALSNPNIEDLDRVDEADEEEEKGEVVSWLERNIGGPSVLSAIRSRSPSPLPSKDRGGGASLLGPATSAADLRARARSDLTGARGKAAVARALADPDVLRDRWDEGAKISRDDSSGNTSRRRRRAPPVMEQEPPLPPKSIMSRKSVSGDSMTGASGDDLASDYYSRSQAGGGSHKGLTYEEAAAAAGVLPPQMGSRTPPRDQPPISRSGSSGAEFDGAFRHSPLHYASKGGGSSRGSLEEYPRRRSQRSPRDDDWSDEFEKPPRIQRRPSGEYLEREDSRGRRGGDKPSPEVAQLLAEFARERQEWKATVSGALDELRELKMKDQMRGRDGPDYAPRRSRRDRDERYTSEVPDWIWQVLAAGGPHMAGMAAQQAGIRLPEGWADERRYREQRYDRTRY